MTTTVLCHPKPMKRHTQHTQPAEAHISVALPGGYNTNHGIHIVLSIPVPSKNDGASRATQKIVFPVDQLEELELAIKTLREHSK